MHGLNRSASGNNITRSRLKVIEDYMDRTAPVTIPCKVPSSKIIQNNKEEQNNNNNYEKSETIDYYPALDATIWLRTCEEEVIEPLSGILTGRIPSWLKGTLLRNGPGGLKVGDYEFGHLFDSSGLLHRFEINNGKVTYQNRYIQTEVYKRNHAAKRIVGTEFGTKAVPDPCQTIFSKISSVFKYANDSDNSLISVYPFGDEYYTFTELPIIHHIDPKSLETLDRVNVENYVNIINQTSHPHVMKDGTVYNVGLTKTTRGLAYAVIKFSQCKVAKVHGAKKKKLSMLDQAEIVTTLPIRWTLHPSYMHTFGITDNYFIIVEQPLSLSIPSLLMAKLKNEPMCSAFKWFGDEDTHIHLVSRETGQLVKSFAAEAFFFLHIINQYETQNGDYVVLDICCYRDAKMLDCMYIDAIKNVHANPDYSKFFRGRPFRFVLPLRDSEQTISEINLFGSNNINEKTTDFFTNNNNFINAEKKLDDQNNVIEDVLHRKPAAFNLSKTKVFVVPEILCDLGCETPRINYESHLGKEYRYFYAIGSDVERENPGVIIKVDTKSKTKLLWSERNVFPSEPIFVPDPNGKHEDDGVILSALLWGQDRESHVALLILNAANFEEIARASFEAPGPVPKCLHGWFSSAVT